MEICTFIVATQCKSRNRLMYMIIEYINEWICIHVYIHTHVYDNWVMNGGSSNKWRKDQLFNLQLGTISFYWNNKVWSLSHIITVWSKINSGQIKMLNIKCTQESYKMKKFQANVCRNLGIKSFLNLKPVQKNTQRNFVSFSIWQKMSGKNRAFLETAF